MSAHKMGRLGVIGVLFVLLSTSVVSAQIPDNAQWIVGDWKHTGVVKVNWSFISFEDIVLRAESEVVTLIRNKPLSKKMSVIFDRGGGEFRSLIFEIKEGRTSGTIMRIDWSDFGPHWIGELSGHTADNEAIEGEVELDKDSDNQFTYKINNLTVGGVQKPDVNLAFLRQ